MIHTQTTNSVLLIFPQYFASNPETMETNAFQQTHEKEKIEEIRSKAIQEFNQFAHELSKKGVRTHIFDESNIQTYSPDAVFPNNWISFHQDGTAVLFPMMALSRRKEIRRDIITSLQHDHAYPISNLVDLTHLVESEEFLEGTGSLVLDRKNRIAYACISPRTHLHALETFCQKMNYTPIPFHATDAHGLPIYHTNVLLSIGSNIVVVCIDGIRNPKEREQVETHLQKSGREIIPVTIEQMNRFACNILELSTEKGPIIVMSESAKNAFTSEQIKKLGKSAKIVSIPIPTIEKYGGGSARCMIAEIFYQK